VKHVHEATTQALADLDASFFRMRFDRLTPAEKVYPRAVAALEAGPHRSFMKRMMPLKALGRPHGGLEACAAWVVSTAKIRANTHRV
jgi:hypothetical protein